MGAALLVFARTPVLGTAKTRLAARLGAGDTLGLYRAFLEDTLVTGRAAEGIERVLWAHTGGLELRDAQRADACFEQQGADFGERLDAALAEAFERVGGGPLLVIGADTPHLSPEALSAAARRLAAAPAVLGPSTKGGFYVAGFAAPPPLLAAAFRAPGEALAVARRLAAAGAPAELLAPFYDVDEPADLTQLAEHLELAHACAAWLPPATFRAMQDLGLIGG